MQPTDQEVVCEERGALLGEEVKPQNHGGRRRVFGAVGLVVLVVAAFLCHRQFTSHAALLPDLTGVAIVQEQEVEPVCSWEGENCISTKCCKRVGLTCWEKLPNSWGGCSKTCEDLKKFGGEWTCAGLGPQGAPKLVLPAAAPPAAPTLFCFMVITAQGVCPPGVQAGYEQKLVDTIRAAKASIFACEASNVFQGAPATTGEWKSIKNTDIFAKVWRDVQADCQYSQHDWTVKVDADAVFFPDRLKMHIISMKPPADEPIYLHNIDFKFHFMGALEVMNKNAVGKLMTNMDECLQHIGNNGGEDIFMMECMDSIGVGYMEDYSLLDDKYSSPAQFNLFDVDRCHNDAIVAFHPYKAVNSWMGCHKVATGEVQTTQFTSCVHRHAGEACSLSGTLDHPGNKDEGGIVG